MTKNVKNLGILGGGQLGRMLTNAAHRMGFRVVTWTGGDKSGAEVLADEILADPFPSLDAFREFIASTDVATIEFENIPTSLLAQVEEQVSLTPSPSAVAICQNRELEKTFLHDNGIKVAPFSIIQSAADLAKELDNLSSDAILKTLTDGYDGKGQVAIAKNTAASQAEAIWKDLSEKPCILEEKIKLAGEFSVIVARHQDGTTASYQPIENLHVNHILDTSIFPARLPEATLLNAQDIAKQIITALDYCGILTIEFFLDSEGGILVNELAPRPHNSGHLTIEAAQTSQFEQQLRIAAQLPLGSAETVCPAVMINLLGDLWPSAELAPDWSPVLAVPGVKLHLYGKHLAKPGRKMGHVTILAETQQLALERAEQVRRILFP